MKKIVFIRANPNAIGGAQRYLSRLIRALNSLGVACEVRSFGGSQKMSSWLKALLFNRQVCKQKRADELYFSLDRITCADIYRAGDGVHKIYRAQKPLWWLNPLNFVYPYLEKKCFENAKIIIANSHFVRRQIIDAYGINANKIHVIHNGITLPPRVEKAVAKLSLCDELGLDFELPIVLFVGSGFKRKGVREFLRILSHVKTGLNALIVGSDKDSARYKKLSRTLGANAVFLGEQKNVSRFYEAADAFLFPTHYEPFSNAVLEAMSYKNVVLTTLQNGAAEVLSEQFIIDPANEEKVAKFIERILTDHEFAAQIGEENYKKARELSIEKNANSTLALIKYALEIK